MCPCPPATIAGREHQRAVAQRLLGELAGTARGGRCASSRISVERRSGRARASAQAREHGPLDGGAPELAQHRLGVRPDRAQEPLVAQPELAGRRPGARCARSRRRARGAGSVDRSISASGVELGARQRQQRLDVPAGQAAELVRDDEQLAEHADGRRPRTRRPRRRARAGCGAPTPPLADRRSRATRARSPPTARRARSAGGRGAHRMA